MRAPFQNEPSVDFSVEENRAAMREALKTVESQLGQRYPLIIGGERRETGPRSRFIRTSSALRGQQALQR